MIVTFSAFLWDIIISSHFIIALTLSKFYHYRAWIKNRPISIVSNFKVFHYTRTIPLIVCVACNKHKYIQWKIQKIIKFDNCTYQTKIYLFLNFRFFSPKHLIFCFLIFKKFESFTFINKNNDFKKLINIKLIKLINGL